MANLKQETSELNSPSSERIPLCVDLDGSLTTTDTFAEAILFVARRKPYLLALLPIWLLRGKANLKEKMASHTHVAPELLPYNPHVLEYVKRARAEGRKTVLATAAHEQVATAVGEHLGLFDECVASNLTRNLRGKAKAQELTRRYGPLGFDYIGNESSDLPIWQVSRRAIIVGQEGPLATRVRALGKDPVIVAGQPTSFMDWIKQLRTFQWVKNFLIFVPVLLSGHTDADSIMRCLIAFISFSLMASCIYVVNDLIDLNADRQHPKKKNRPLASGRIALLHGIYLIPVLFMTATVMALYLTLDFTFLLFAYAATSLAYSVRIKQIAIADVLTLAILFTVRLFAGSVAAHVPISAWLLAFSMFFFFSLALIKRTSELVIYLDLGSKEAPRSRGYVFADLPQLSSIGSASGFVSILVIALYINSPDVKLLYPRPQFLWAICPMLIYWLTRCWLLVYRGQMNHDPVVYALKDKSSYFVIGVIALSWVIAKGIL